MIKRLRRNFVLVAMCSTFIVLFLIVGTLNVASYCRMVSRADEILQVLAENDARFPLESPPDINHKRDAGFQSGNMMMPRDAMTPETPYETRFFSARMSDSGEVLAVDTGKIAAIETQEAVSIAVQLWNSGKMKGFHGDYRYLIVKKDVGNFIILIDRGRELASQRMLLRSSVVISIIGLLAVLVLVLIFSRKVFKPVVESYQKQKQFITDASHELKTPLAVILADVEVLEMEGEENKWTQGIRRQVERMSSLVEQMVSLSKMDEETREWEFTDFSLKEAVGDTAELFVPVASRAGKMFLIQLPDAVCMYHGDEGRIRQAVSLLLDNAMKYSDEHGRIELCLSAKGKRYELTLQNSVETIPKGNLDMLFERFYRLDSSRNSHTGGSGIGLSVVKSIVELHHGKVSAVSEDGESVRFKIIL